MIQYLRQQCFEFTPNVWWTGYLLSLVHLKKMGTLKVIRLFQCRVFLNQSACILQLCFFQKYLRHDYLEILSQQPKI